MRSWSPGISRRRCSTLPFGGKFKIPFSRAFLEPRKNSRLKNSRLKNSSGGSVHSLWFSNSSIENAMTWSSTVRFSRRHRLLFLRGQVPRHSEALRRQLLRGAAGTNCIKVGLPGKRILSKRKGLGKSYSLEKKVSENRVSGKTYFYTIASRAGRSTGTRTGALRWG